MFEMSLESFMKLSMMANSLLKPIFFSDFTLHRYGFLNFFRLFVVVFALLQTLVSRVDSTFFIHRGHEKWIDSFCHLLFSRKNQGFS